MRRVLGRLVHNWPLKLAAVGLATLMYAGLAVSQNTSTYPGAIPITFVNEPKDTVVLSSTPTAVNEVRYFAPNGVLVGASSFLATIDLSGLVKPGTYSVRIDVTTPDSRIRVLGSVPAFATVVIDDVVSRNDIPVRVVHGTVPDGLKLGPTTFEPATVTVSGARSIVSKVDAARANVVIQSAGIDIDNDVQLIPVDKIGNALSPLDVTPSSARVAIPVFSDQQTRTLPVFPIIAGTPAPGFEIESVTVTPQVALVGGDAAELAKLTQLDTDPIRMTGVSSSETVDVKLDLPPGVVAAGNDTISVAIGIRPVTGTRTFSAGLQLAGASSDLTYALSTDRVLVTIGGSTADLDRLSGSTIVVDLEVAGLAPGVHVVPVTANLPTGLTLVAASPPTVTVTIGLPTASPGPGASPASPSGG